MRHAMNKAHCDESLLHQHNWTVWGLQLLGWSLQSLMRPDIFTWVVQLLSWVLEYILQELSNGLLPISRSYCVLLFSYVHNIWQLQKIYKRSGITSGRGEEKNYSPSSPCPIYKSPRQVDQYRLHSQKEWWHIPRYWKLPFHLHKHSI